MPGSSPIPPYARAPKRSRGCLVASVVLLLVLVLGGTGVYFAVRHGVGNGNQSGKGAHGQQRTPSSRGGNTPRSRCSTPSGSAPITEQSNFKVACSTSHLTLV